MPTTAYSPRIFLQPTNQAAVVLGSQPACTRTAVQTGCQLLANQFPQNCVPRLPARYSFSSATSPLLNNLVFVFIPQPQPLDCPSHLGKLGADE